MFDSEKQLDACDSSIDQRRAHRWKTSILCLVDWNGKLMAGTILDLSDSGAFIEMPEAQCPAGSVVRLEFEVRKIPVEVRATVVHGGWYLGDDRNFKGFGVQFNSPSPEVVGLIRDVVRDSKVPAPVKCVLES